MSSLPMPRDPINFKTIEDTIRTLDREGAFGRAQSVRQTVKEALATERPSPMEVIVESQRQDAQQRDYVADALAQMHYSRATIGDLEPRDVAQCRYAATGALRRLNAYWNDAARQEAEAAARYTIRHECGMVLSLLKDETASYIASQLTTAIVTTYLGVLEGSIRLTPADYYAIVTGEAKR